MSRPLLCPLCMVPMRPVAGLPGLWKCTRVPEHEFDEDGASEDVTPEEEAAWSRTITENPLLDRAGQGVAPRYWLSHIGIDYPLHPPPQSNGGDGSYCQPLGDIAPGGGSKSGKRKKSKKKPPQPELWGA
jgi:hypothetical protein